MRILLLSDINSSHTRKWVAGILGRGAEVGVFSLSNPKDDWHSGMKNLRVFNFSGNAQNVFDSSSFSKLRYLLYLPFLRKLIRDFKPDILHAHYASSYGLLGALSGFHPYILSVWGSDVYDFPVKSILHRWILQYNLRKADAVLSTSKVMAVETGKYTRKPIEVTPFGVDTSVFTTQRPLTIEPGIPLVMGTIKALEEKYGVEYLLKAYKIVYEAHPEIAMRLLIVGGGQLEGKLRQMATDLNIAGTTEFTGPVPHTEVVKYHNELDIYVALSLPPSESFGVAIIEASACGRPVVVSNTGGLPEVVVDGITGYVVPVMDELTTSRALEKLILDPGLRVKIGQQGRQHVIDTYEWKDCLEQMMGIYERMLGRH